MSDLPPPPPDDSGWSSQPPLQPGPPAQDPQPAKGWATLGTGGTVQLARPASRLVARIIDGTIVGAVDVIFLLLVGFFTAFDMGDFLRGEEDIAIGVNLASLAIGLLYEVGLIAARGQTLGKMALKVKVVRADNGLVPGWGKSAGRWLVPAIPALGWFIPSISFIGFLSPLVYVSLTWDKVRQGWHDKAAGTLVIKV